MHTPKSRDRRNDARAFTLIELLVVISIISLLISILLPALSSARRSGQRVACLAATRAISQGAASYATDSEDAIIGSPGTSGAYLLDRNGPAYGPAVQRWDFMGPLAASMGISILESDGNGAALANRFNDLRAHPAFLCRGNNFLSGYFAGDAGVNPGTGRLVSYATSRYMLMANGKENGLTKEDGTNDAAGLSWYGGDHEEKTPKAWKPVVGRLGVPAHKVFCGDGGMYSTSNSSDGITLPDYDIRCQGGWGGTFSAAGPYSKFSRAWDRARAPLNGYRGRTDARAFGFRHSASANVAVGAKENAYKGNFIFFDGHGETMGDLDASNPHIWLPQGTMLGPLAMQPDVIARWGITDTIRIGP